VFQGKIFVDSIAQKTNAYQLSKGLLLDEESEFSTKPELEIYADDVKCSHGSTSGNIDKEALFYLKARGIKEKEAIKMIIKGFLESVLEKIKDKDITDILLNHFNKHIKYEYRSN
jgi:Fe-S cluster assembly protein SufD